ncbi:MAG: hypothetical protein HQK50_08560 [Oligoflexia bacterium]|nr:hypothetical protein [Oligoflexia bacterium]
MIARLRRFHWPLLLLSLVFMLQEVGFVHARLNGDDLEKTVAMRMLRVTEFKDIQDKCEEMHVPCYLFGGTAAAYVDYVHRDLERELEHKDYNPYRFNYDLNSIFNSNQDYDIVMDGTLEQVKTLQAYLESKYPYMQGEHTAWEVRPLRMQNGNKAPLLGPNYDDNSDFLKQHTDSYSQGMVAINSPGEGEQWVLDLKHWKKSNPRLFLNDVINHQIHYLENDKHTQSARYNDSATGNPQILSVIRYLIKVLQYGATIPDEDKEHLSKVIANFDPESIRSNNQYLKHWIEFNGKKIVTNSLDVERSFELLRGKYWGIPEEKNLRVKLSQLGLNDAVGGLKWWMKKEPLRSTRPCGEGGDQKSVRAKDLGIKQINHVVKELDAFENIIRPYDQSINALISRDNTYGEAAVYGDGFYVSRGEKDYYGTGMMILMDLDENALQGMDFDIAKNDSSILIIKNKNCIHRNYDHEKGISLEEFVRRLLTNKGGTSVGYLSRMQKKAEAQYLALTPQEKSEFNQFIRDHIVINEYPSAWFKSKLSQLFPNVIEMVIERSVADREIAQYVLSQPYWSNHPELVAALIRNGRANEEIARSVLSQPHWKDHPELVEALVKKGGADGDIARSVLSQPHWKDHPELVETLLSSGKADHAIAAYVLNQPHWQDHPELVETLLKKGTADGEIVRSVLSRPHWKDHPEWVEMLVNKGSVDQELAWSVLGQAHWKDHPEWVETLLNRGKADMAIASCVLNRAHWKDHPEWVETLLSRGKADQAIVTYVLSQAHWKDHPEWVETLIKKGTIDWDIAWNVLSQPHWKDHPELVEALIINGKADRAITDHVLNQPHWKNYFKKLTKEVKPSVDNIRKFYNEHSRQITAMKAELARRSAEYATLPSGALSFKDFLKSNLDDPVFIACIPGDLIPVYDELLSGNQLLIDQLIEGIVSRLQVKNRSLNSFGALMESVLSICPVLIRHLF